LYQKLYLKERRFLNNVLTVCRRDGDMNVYTHTKFTGHYPVGTSAVVWAESPTEALYALNESLVLAGLEGDAKFEDLKLFMKPVGLAEVRILCDGNY